MIHGSFSMSCFTKMFKQTNRNQTSFQVILVLGEPAYLVFLKVQPLAHLLQKCLRCWLKMPIPGVTQDLLNKKLRR